MKFLLELKSDDLCLFEAGINLTAIRNFQAFSFFIREDIHMFDRIKKLFSRDAQDTKTAADTTRNQTSLCWTCDSSGKQASSDRGMITRTCKKCGKTFTLPEEVQHWPDCCQECRRKYHIVEQITRKCRGCGKEFTFPSDVWHWPNYCRECQAKRKAGKHD